MFMTYYPWALIGIFIHMLMKLYNAKLKDGYSVRAFLKINWLRYLISFACSTVLTAWMSTPEGLPGFTPSIGLSIFGIGIGGTELFKMSMKRYEPKLTKNGDDQPSNEPEDGGA